MVTDGVVTTPRDEQRVGIARVRVKAGTLNGSVEQRNRPTGARENEMKRFVILLCVAAVVGLAVSSDANAAIQLHAEFPTIVNGGLSYDQSGDNVVVSGLRLL